MGELEAVVEDGDLAREHRPGARLEVLVRLVHAPAEEDESQRAAAVGDGDFEPFAAPGVEGVHAGVGDLGDHRDVLVQREVGEGGQLAALGVTAWVVVKEVPDGVQVEVVGHHLRGGRADYFLQVLIERGHVVHCTPRG